MERWGNALEDRVRVLLAHLDDAPGEAAVLPFTVAYLVEQLREAVSALPACRRAGNSWRSGPAPCQAGWLRYRLGSRA